MKAFLQSLCLPLLLISTCDAHDTHSGPTRGTWGQNLGLLGATLGGGVMGGFLGGRVGVKICESNRSDTEVESEWLSGLECLNEGLTGGIIGYNIGSLGGLYWAAYAQDRKLSYWAPAVYSLSHQLMTVMISQSTSDEDLMVTFLLLNPAFIMTGALIHERTGLAINPTASLTPRGNWNTGLQVAGRF